MFVKHYEYLLPTENCKDHIEIKGIDRTSYATPQYIDRIGKITLERPTAVLYAGGVGITQAESRQLEKINPRTAGSVEIMPSGMLIKEINAYCMHKWIGSMENNHLVKYANINTNTCASSMYCLYEAERLLETREVDEVVIIAEERTSFNTIRIFKEHGIPLIVADGMAIMVLQREETNIEISDTKWGYEYNRNPFGTTVSGYGQMLDTEYDSIKPHGTRTGNNDAAEAELVDGYKCYYLKDEIGHTQGVSALLEVCMLVTRGPTNERVLCVASGLGGFYGRCVLHKRQ